MIVPARELLGDLLLELGQPRAALAEYEASLTATPNRLHGLSGAARAAKASGEEEKAASYYQKVMALADGANGERAEIAEARKAANREK